ncbi:MAG: DUF2125 domain-containing protein [Roseibium sp.]
MLVAIVAVVTTWTGAWFYGRSVLAAQLDQQIRRLADDGVDLACADLTIAGYPFRYEVGCRSMRSSDRSGAAGSLGGLNAVALIYNPRHAIFEAASPASLDVPLAGVKGDLTWDTARASLKFSDSSYATLGALDAVLEAPRAAFASADAGGLASAGRAELHLREAPSRAGTLEGFLTVDALKLDSLPELQETLGLRLHARVEGGTALLAGADLAALVAAGGGALPLDLVEAEVRLASGRAAASGDLILADDGTLSGTLELTLGNADALLEALRPLFPPQDRTYPVLKTVVQSLPAAEAEGERTATIPVTLNRGQVLLGFLPAGRIPPLF